MIREFLRSLNPPMSHPEFAGEIAQLRHQERNTVDPKRKADLAAKADAMFQRFMREQGWA